MKQIEIEQRVLNVAEYILETKGTIRQCASHFKMSKSTVHNDLCRLKNVDFTKFNEVRKILDINWNEKYLRGGLATKKKYAKGLN